MIKSKKSKMTLSKDLLKAYKEAFKSADEYSFLPPASYTEAQLKAELTTNKRLYRPVLVKLGLL